MRVRVRVSALNLGEALATALDLGEALATALDLGEALATALDLGAAVGVTGKRRERRLERRGERLELDARAPKAVLADACAEVGLERASRRLGLGRRLVVVERERLEPAR